MLEPYKTKSRRSSTQFETNDRNVRLLTMYSDCPMISTLHHTTRIQYELNRKTVVKPATMLLLMFIVLSACAKFALGNEPSFPFGVSDADVPDELKLFQTMPTVITAARKPQTITEAPSTIDVVTAEDIRRSGALTLAEVLERLPGMYTPTAHNALDMLWIRGVGGRFNDNALLLIDGQPYRTLYYSNFPINEQIPLEDIKKIEIIRGPGSALYGTNAFTGVINVITKNVVDMKKNEIAVSYGSEETQNHYAFLGKEFESGEINIFGKYFDRDGYRTRRDDAGRPSNIRRGSDNRAFKLKLRYKNFDFNIRYSKFRLDNFTVALDEEENGDEHTREHLLSQVGYNRDFGEKLSIQIKAYVNSYDFDSTGVGQDEEDLSITSRGKIKHDGLVTGIDILSTLSISENQTLLFGVNYEYEYLERAWIKVSELIDDEEPELGLGPFELTEWASESGGDTPESIDNNNVGAYLEYELKLLEKVILTGGLRFDSFEASESRFSPRGSIVFTPDDRTAVKLRYGEAFRAPTYQELYKQVDDGEGEGNLDLRPQTIRTAEFELSRFLWDNHRVNITVFYSEFDRFIRVFGDGDFENLSRRDFYGFELGLNGNLFKNLSYFGNYSFTKAEEIDGTDIAGVPENMGNIGFNYMGLKYVEIIPHLRLVGERNRPENYQEDVEENPQNLLGGFAILNLTLLSKNLPGPFTASLTIRNLLDKTYHTPGEESQNFDIRQPGRRILFKLALEF